MEADQEAAALAPVEAVSRTDDVQRAETRVVKPQERLILVPVRNMVLFPGVVLPVVVGRERSVQAIQDAVRTQSPLGLVLQRDESVENPRQEDLHTIGTVAEVLRYLTAPDGRHHAICQGQQRFRLIEVHEDWRVLSASVVRIEEDATSTPSIEARFLALKEQAQEVLRLAPGAPEDLASVVAGVGSPAMLADMVATFLDIPLAEKQEILETLDIEARMAKVGEKLGRLAEVLQLSQKIRQETRGSMDRQQREFYLREQLRAIQKELGTEDETRSEIAALREAIDKAKMPPDVDKDVRKELRRLERMPETAAEYSMLRTYLDVMIDLPWSTSTVDVLDLAEARRILDEDHHGLEKVKRLILEYLAVTKLKPEGRRPNLCLVGPPGVGKTSLGHSIARAMGRKFVRISLGGVHDEAEIRGHRRTYIGAMPGSIVQGIRKGGTLNPVFMLDEMDKLGQGFHGDPSSALLEVLDPEQNKTFRDNYLGVPFDVSRVLFIGTANVLHNIPGPLRDRFEVIALPGYTQEEKLAIAKRYLLPRQLDASGLTKEQLRIEDRTVVHVITDYTREAGVRSLDRQLGSVTRWAAAQIAEGKTQKLLLRPRDLAPILGAPRYESEAAMRTSVPGVATGLAWTAVGGEILFVEATAMPGRGQLLMTGQLGDVMRESAQASLSLVKSRAKRLKLPPKFFEQHDIHMHLPAGAIPKDGPSAGVTMYTALISLLLKRTVRSDVAMTGEISLRGLVLPVGGIKEKVLGAQQAGITTVLLPERNKPDLDDVPQSARDKITFKWMRRVEDAIAFALEPAPKANGAKPGATPEDDLAAEKKVAAGARTRRKRPSRRAESK